MKRTVIILCAAVILSALCLSVPVSAQDRQGGGMNEERINKIAEKLGITPEEVKERMRQRQGGDAAGGQAGRGGIGMQGQQGRPEGFRPQNSVQEAPAQMLATDKYLFILKGNTVYQLDIDSLKLLNQTELPEQKREGIQDAIKRRIQERAEQTRMKIEQLRDEGKNEEADKLQQQLDNMLKHLEKGKGMWNQPKGDARGNWKKLGDKQPAEGDKHEDGGGLF